MANLQVRFMSPSAPVLEDIKSYLLSKQYRIIERSTFIGHLYAVDLICSSFNKLFVEEITAAVGSSDFSFAINAREFRDPCYIRSRR